MKLKYAFAVREVGGSAMAVAVGEDSDKFNGLVRLNAVGRIIFEMLADSVTEEEIVSRILAEYEVTEEAAARSVSSFIAKLRGEGLIAD